MSKKRVDYVVASQLMKAHLSKFDELDEAINAVPEGADGGEASAEISFVLTSALESAGIVSDSLRVLYSVADDAVYDLAVNDQDSADELKKFEKEVRDA